MKKILIIGSKGMAGHVLYNYFKENTDFTLIDIARGTDFHIPCYQLDVTDFKQLESVILNEMPSVIINCVGVLNQDAEDHPDKAVLLNSYLPHFLARQSTFLRAKLIHISTDCVFSGKRGGYLESDMKDGSGFYAQSKALGEVSYDNHLTFRTSIVGPVLKGNGIGLFNWFMHQQGDINGYTEAYWSGVTTFELAKAILASIEQDITGLYHLVNNIKISKYDLLQVFSSTFARENISIRPFDGYKVDKSLVNTRNDFDYEVPTYEQMIRDMKHWVNSHKEFYSEYLT